MSIGLIWGGEAGKRFQHRGRGEKKMGEEKEEPASARGRGEHLPYKSLRAT
jgi:hypothetical protein